MKSVLATQTGRTTLDPMEGGTATDSKLDLEESVKLYYEQVYGFAWHLCRNEADAKDLTQYAFEQLARRHDQVKDATKVRAWLQSTLYRKFIDQKRKLIRFPSVDIEDEQVPLQSTTLDPGRNVDAKAALAALDGLEEDLRLPLSLFYVNACSYKEIAQILGIQTGTVMSRLYRGKEKLYQQLTGLNS